MSFGGGVSIPAGGGRPAAGSVVSAYGELDLGWRLHRFVGLHVSLSSNVHDVARRTIIDADGFEVDQVDNGRLTSLDLATVRVWLPRPRRFEPWIDVGAGLGLRRAPFEARRQATALARLGLGCDLWLSPAFSLGFSSAYRMVVLDKQVGHAIRAGVDLSVHW